MNNNFMNVDCRFDEMNNKPVKSIQSFENKM